MFNPTAPFKLLHIVAETGEDFLFAPFGGSSAPGDTPSTIPFYPLLRPSGNPVDWKVVDTSGEWIDMGGVVEHKTYVFTADNDENPDTHTRPLDNLLGLNFRQQDAIWYGASLVSTGSGWDVPTLSMSTVIGRGTIISADFTDDTFVVRIREITEERLRVPTTPVQFFGRGGGVHVETGGAPTTGARVSRPDHPDIRGLGSQWFATSFSLLETGGTSAITVVDSPIFRVRIGATGSTISTQMRNLAGTWMNVGTPAGYVSGIQDTRSILVNYDLGSTTAELFVDGVSAGSTVITGGIFVASAAPTTFYNTAAAGTTELTHWFFRHGTRLLPAPDIMDRALFTFDFFGEAGLTAALEFTERVGLNVQDLAGNASATLEGFSDNDGAWRASQTGEASMSHKRPNGIVGCPFNIKGQVVDLAFGDYIRGFEGEDAGRQLRSMLFDGARIRAPFNHVSDMTFTAADFQVANFVSFAGPPVLVEPFEPAVGQDLIWSAAPNAGTITPLSVIVDPVIGKAFTGLVFNLIVAQTLVDDGPTFGTMTDSGDSRWDNSPSSESVGIDAAYDVVRLDFDTAQSGITMLVGRQRVADPSPAVPDASGHLVPNFLRFLGPQIIAILTNLEEVNIRLLGWQGPGEEGADKPAHELAKVTPSTDFGPSVVHTRFSDSSLRVTGADMDASGAAVFSFGEPRIKAAKKARFESRLGAVRVRYAKNWTFTEGDQGAIPRGSTADVLADALSSEWREVVRGAGAIELVVDTMFLRPEEAGNYADAVLKNLEDGLIYEIDLYGPLTPEELVMEPFDVVSVTWPPDSFLSAGKKGIAVGLTVKDDWSAKLLVYFEE